MIVHVGHVKGGIGKSTLAVNIAAARARQGKKVWLIDGDRKPSSSECITLRNESGIQPAIAMSHFVDGRTLRTQVQVQQETFDDIVIDTGGMDSTCMRAALMLADVLIVPNGIHAVETRALEQLEDLVKEALSQRDGLRVHTILNNAQPRYESARNKAARDVLLYYPALNGSDLMVESRFAFSDSMAMGLCVHEMDPPDPKACKQLDQLMTLIFGDTNG